MEGVVSDNTTAQFGQFHKKSRHFQAFILYASCPPLDAEKRYI
jgi:hypothetical protein